jgi:hypothetical protein
MTQLRVRGVGKSGGGGRLRRDESTAAIPSIKGTAFAFVVEKVSKLISAGEISRDELARRLPPGGLEAVDRPVVLVGWYDIRIYVALMELLRDIVGDGENEYLVRHGEEAAERLLHKGFYQQMEYLKRMAPGKETDPHVRYEAFGRDLRRLVSLSPSILNFGHLMVREDPEYPDRYMLEASDGRAFPEVLCWSMQGFYNRMAATHDSPDLWRLDRPQPDLVRHRMTRSL